MNEEQWAFIYEEIKDFFTKHIGIIPNDKIAKEAMELHDNIMTITAKSRSANSQIETDIQQVMGMVFKVIHSLEVEGKTV